MAEAAKQASAARSAPLKEQNPPPSKQATVEPPKEEAEVKLVVASSDAAVLPSTSIPSNGGHDETDSGHSEEEGVKDEGHKSDAVVVVASKQMEMIKDEQRVSQSTEEEEEEVIAVSGAAGSGMLVSAGRKKPGIARRGTASRATIRDQAKQAQQQREEDDKQLEAAMNAPPKVMEEKEVLVVEGNFAEKRRSLAAAIPVGAWMGGAGKPRKLSRPEQEDPDHGEPPKPEVVKHTAPQMSLGMGDLSNALGSLRKRPPAAAEAKQSEASPIVPIAKPSELRAAKLAAAKEEQPRKGFVDLLKAIKQLEEAPSRVSMSDVAYEDLWKPEASPRVKELDGLIQEARQAAAVQAVEPPKVETPLDESAPVEPKRRQLEAVSPYESSGDSDSEEQEPVAVVQEPLVPPPKVKLLAQLQQADHDLANPSPLASRQSMHVVEYKSDESDDEDSSFTE